MKLSERSFVPFVSVSVPKVPPGILAEVRVGPLAEQLDRVVHGEAADLRDPLGFADPVRWSIPPGFVVEKSTVWQAKSLCLARALSSHGPGQRTGG